jgi:tetratricopeptide (TPR) repeat protein
MILRLSTSAERGFLAVAALGLAVFLSYFSIRNALAQHQAGLETAQGFARATHLEPGNAGNWYLLGRYWQYNLEDPDTARAIAAYRTSLSFAPESADTWLDLAAAYESESDTPAARDAFRKAKEAYPLSAVVAWRYGNFLLRQGEQEAAFREIRRAVQADPKRAAEAFSRCLRVDPDINAVLDQVLPPSRDVYVDVLWDLLGDGKSEDALQVWSRLTALHPQLPLSDIYPLVDALTQKKQLQLARQVWDQAVTFTRLPQPLDPPGSLIWDGGFESGITGVGFAWKLPPVSRGVQAGIDAHEKHSGKYSLRVSFDGKLDVNFQDVCQLVPVQPSTAYQFSAWVQTRELTTDEGIRFRLNAFSPAGVSSVFTEDVRGTVPWKKIEILWQSGNGVNAMQICLKRNPSAAADNRIQGTAWIDDVALLPASAENAQP